MKKIKILSLGIIFFLVSCSYMLANTATTSCDNGSNSCEVKAENIYMTYQKTTNPNEMLVTVSAKTSGWVAVGFGATDDMKDANIIIGYIDKNNKPVISNDYGVSKWSHKALSKLNAKSEAQIVSGSYKDGWSTIQFTMPLVSNDKKYGKVFTKGADISVILAYAANGDKNFTAYHQYRAKGEITDFYLR